MLGHSYAGYRPMQHQHQKTQTAFAWIPKRSTFGKKFIWLQKYYVVSIFHDRNGKPPISSQSWDYIYTEQEYLMHLLGKG